MRGYEAAQILKEKGITVEDVAEEITYRKETNAFSNNPKNEAFMNMTLNELVRKRCGISNCTSVYGKKSCPVNGWLFSVLYEVCFYHAQI